MILVGARKAPGRAERQLSTLHIALGLPKHSHEPGPRNRPRIGQSRDKKRADNILSPRLFSLVEANTIMVIGDRLREFREQKQFSQGDIEKRTGLLRCYISRVENGHTVPSIETLEKMANALEMPMYHLFYDGEKPPALPKLIKHRTSKIAWGSSGKDARFLNRLRRALSRADQKDRQLLLDIAQRMVPR
jgi:transcriptional regulator with XRE-family HTH domain